MLLLEQALHDALMRQEELLAYIDRQEEAKLRVSFKFFVSPPTLEFSFSPYLVRLIEDVFITVPLRRRGLAGEEVTPVLDELCRGMFVLTSLVRRIVA